MHVEPVSPYPPATSRTLDGWLSVELAALHPADASTRLREIADGQAARAGAWAAGVAVGASTLLMSALLWVFTHGNVLAPALCGALLAIVCAVFLRRSGHRLPRRSVSVRGPGSLRSGIIAALVLYACVTVPGILIALTTGGGLPLLLANIGLLLLLISAFVVPAAVLGRGRDSLRRRARTDQELRAALEEDRMRWVPTPGVPLYGPL